MAKSRLDKSSLVSKQDLQNFIDYSVLQYEEIGRLLPKALGRSTPSKHGG